MNSLDTSAHIRTPLTVAMYEIFSRMALHVPPVQTKHVAPQVRSRPCCCAANDATTSSRVTKDTQPTTTASSPVSTKGTQPTTTAPSRFRCPAKELPSPSQSGGCQRRAFCEDYKQSIVTCNTQVGQEMFKNQPPKFDRRKIKQMLTNAATKQIAEWKKKPSKTVYCQIMMDVGISCFGGCDSRGFTDFLSRTWPDFWIIIKNLKNASHSSYQRNSNQHTCEKFTGTTDAGKFTSTTDAGGDVGTTRDCELPFSVAIHIGDGCGPCTRSCFQAVDQG